MAYRSTKILVSNHMKNIINKVKNPNLNIGMPMSINLSNYGNNKVAVVTGATNGIGLAIVRGLCQRFHGDVILTARSIDNIYKAKRQLRREGLYPKSHLLDINNAEHIDGLRVRLSQQYGGLDVLVNNAAIMYTTFDGQGKEGRSADHKLFAAIVKETVENNYVSTRNLCQELFPLLRQHARVCNMSSFASINALMLLHQRLLARLFSPELTMEELNDFMREYIDCAERSIEGSGYVMSPLGAYGTSKLAVNLMTELQQRAFDARDDLLREAGHCAMDVLVNACSPGYVTTEMTGNRGQISTEAGAETPLYLCLLPPHTRSPRGQLVRHKRCIDLWMDAKGEVHVVFNTDTDNGAQRSVLKSAPPKSLSKMFNSGLKR